MASPEAPPASEVAAPPATEVAAGVPQHNRRRVVRIPVRHHATEQQQQPILLDWRRRFAQACTQWNLLKERIPAPVHCEGDGESPNYPRVTNEQRERFSCPICLSFMDIPVSTPCHHNFCASCLAKQQQSHCALCREAFESDQIVIAENLFSEMCSSHIQCDCRLIHSPLLAHSHGEGCPQALVNCPQRPLGCQFRGIRQTLPDHLSKCPYEAIKGIFQIFVNTNHHLNLLERRISGLTHQWSHQTHNIQQLLLNQRELQQQLSRPQQNPSGKGLPSFLMDLLWNGSQRFSQDQWPYRFELEDLIFGFYVLPLFLFLGRSLLLGFLEETPYLMWMSYSMAILLFCAAARFMRKPHNGEIFIRISLCLISPPVLIMTRSIAAFALLPGTWVLCFALESLQKFLGKEVHNLVPSSLKFGYGVAIFWKLFPLLIPTYSLLGEEHSRGWLTLVTSAGFLLWNNPAASLRGMSPWLQRIFFRFPSIAGILGACLSLEFSSARLLPILPKLLGLLLTLNVVMGALWLIDLVSKWVDGLISAALTQDSSFRPRELLVLVAAAYGGVLIPWV